MSYEGEFEIDSDSELEFKNDSESESLEPYKSGYYQYEFNRVRKLKQAIDDSKNNEDHGPGMMCDHNRYITKILYNKYNENKKIFLEKFGKDPRFLDRVKIIEERNKPVISLPNKFDSSLIDFFNSLDLGLNPDGLKLQETPECEVFFKDGVSYINSLRKLIRIWDLNHRFKDSDKSKEQITIFISGLKRLNPDNDKITEIEFGKSRHLLYSFIKEGIENNIIKNPKETLESYTKKAKIMLQFIENIK